MPITEVRGRHVDCHVCRTTTPLNSEPEAHAWAQGHAESHQQAYQAPRHLAPPQPPAFPRHAKTTIPHGRYILLTICTGGLYLLWYLKAWFRAGRKTTFG